MVLLGTCTLAIGELLLLWGLAADLVGVSSMTLV